MEFRNLDEESASGAEDGAIGCDENCEEFVEEEEGEAELDAGIVEGEGEGEPADDEVSREGLSIVELADLDAIYPKGWPLTREQIRKGGSVALILGIMYCFLGISLATQHYINPSIDIIKKKGVLSSESMNATLLAMTNSAAESFIILCSIWFGVSDIGISTVVQQAAFY